MLRAAATGAALVVAAWCALTAFQADRLSAVEDRVERLAVPTQAQAAQARRWLRQAEVLRPGRDGELLEARLELALGRWVHADRLLTRITAAEPDNLVAWRTLAFVRRTFRGRDFEEPEREVRRLEPPVPAP